MPPTLSRTCEYDLTGLDDTWLSSQWLDVIGQTTPDDIPQYDGPGDVKTGMG